MSKNFYTGTDADLYTGGEAFSDKISETPTAFGLTAAQATAFAEAYQAYATAYTTALDPQTRTRGQTAAKNAARDELRTMCSDYASIINGTSTVTDQQKIDLGLNVRKKPSPVPAPTARPGVTVAGVSGRTVTIDIRDSAGSSRRRKAAGAITAMVYSYVGETYPSDPLEWQFQGLASKSTHEIVFPDSVSGGTQVWVCAAWVTRRGESSPASVPVSTYLQGGGVNATTRMKIAA